MDHSKSSKPSMSFPSIKYKVNQEELEEVYSSDTEKSSNLESSDFSPKARKVEKSSPSILNKYFKAFKAERTSEDEVRAEDIPEKKTSELSTEISGSPIKEYFSKFNKRSDSVETASEVDSIKETRDINDRWKLFSDFKEKIVQAVEDIKSSRVVEGDKHGSVDNISDSEDNSIQQDLEQNSCASTENQVSSIASSTHNLSDLSPPIISHSSSTITDSEMETTSSNDSHINVTPTEEMNEDMPRIKSADEKPKTESLLGEVFPNSDEIESGVDALEDIELVKVNQDDTRQEAGTSSDKISEISTQSELKLVVPQKEPFFSTMMIFLTFLVLFTKMLIPSFVTLNGFFIGIWFSYVINKAYYFVLEFLGYNEILNYDILKLKDYQNVAFTKIPQILEFEPLKKYEGWVNLYTVGKYDPILYHVSMTQTIFLKLEGSVLRLSFTHDKIPKRALWDEKEHKVTFYEHQICDLEGASIQLLPAGIVKKRHWSKKYPICVILKDKSKLQIQSHPASKNSLTISGSVNEDIVSNTQNSQATDSNKKEPIMAIPHPSDDSDFKGESPKRIKEPSPENANEVSPNTNESPIAIKSKDILKRAKDTFKSRRRRRKNIEKKVRTSAIDDFLDFDMDEDEDDDYEERYDDESLASSSEDEFGNNNIKVSEKFKEVMNSNENVGKVLDDSKEPESDVCFDSEPKEIAIYIFGRTGRDKAEWFRRIKCAIDDANVVKDLESVAADEAKREAEDLDGLDKTDMLEDDSSKKEVLESRVRLGSVKMENRASTPGVSRSDTPSVLWTPGSTNKESLLTGAFHSAQDVDFWRYMKSIIESQRKDEPKREMHTDDFMWLNAMLGRIAFDTFRNPIWVAKLQERIQKKLSSLKLPSFMGPLSVSALDMGCEAPQVHKASAPTLDSCGLWLDLQVSYTGRATMTLTTQLNLMSLKEKRDTCTDNPPTGDNNISDGAVSKKNTMAVYYSDLEDTAESSSDDDANFTPAQLSKTVSETIPSPHVNIGNTPAKKLLRMVDKIAASKYFQHVTEYKYVKRAMEGVSNTDLKLNVELCALIGCFIINIPPPPSDRLWFGFRGSPQMVLKAKPIFGSRVINFGHVTSWIEKRLCKEFEKILVYPNMEDIIIDSMPAPPVD